VLKPVRSFATCSSDDVQQLEKRRLSKKTEYSKQSVTNTLQAFLQTKNLAAIPGENEQLDTLLSSFWPSLRTIKGEQYRASSMMTIRNMLRLVIQDAVAIDIFSKDHVPRNIKVFENYLKTLKNEGLGYVSHHAEVSKEDLHKLRENLDVADPQQLLWLAWVFIQLHLCRRGFQNSTSMKKSDLVVDKSGAITMIRLARNFHEENHAEVDEDASNGGRIAEIPGNSKCPVKVITKYIEKLNPKCQSLWQRPKKTATDEMALWYDNAPLGHKTLQNMMKSISLFCGLTKTYTNHCLRVSSCSLLGEAGFSDLDIIAVSKHKNLSSLGIYKRVREERKMEMSHSLSHAMGLVAEHPTSYIPHPEEIETSKGTETTMRMDLSNSPQDHPGSSSILPFPQDQPGSSDCCAQSECPPINDNDWNALLAECEKENSAKVFQSNTINQQAVKKGNKVVILNNCSGITFNM